MKRILVLTVMLIVNHYAKSQTVFGYWYGYANVKTVSSSNNYLVELILQPERDYVKGIINYYFKNTYRSLPVKGNYNKATRQLSLYNIPITYYGSYTNFEVDCIMNLQASLRVSQAGSDLVGGFYGLQEYKYTCPDITFNMHLNADISKKDSVLKAMSEFKENYQVWKPSATDTLTAVTFIDRKVVNYVIEKQYTERKNELIQEIEVDSDSLRIDFYDNGEIDGDTISVFVNNRLTAFTQRLSSRPLHFDIALDTTKPYNEVSMFAENLGSIPPNTALMLIDDGKNRYEARLASTYEKNATIRIKRKTVK
jgi:hypothetical protein